MTSPHTAKLMGKEPTAGEIRFCKAELLGGRDPEFAIWVTKRKREKVQDRLIVVGHLKVFSLKKTLTGRKQIRRCGHLFDLKEINTSDVDRVVLKFRDFDIDIQAPNAGTQLVSIIRVLFQKISFGFAPTACPKIIVTPTERGIDALPDLDPGIAAGILPCYAAWCDYFHQDSSVAFSKFIEDTVARNSRDLLLNACADADRRDLLSFAPISAALRHNQYFVKLQLTDVARRDFVGACADAMSSNDAIQILHMRHVGGQEKDFMRLGASIRENSRAALTDLDCSHNDVKDKGAAALGDAIAKLTVNVTRMALARCGIGARGAGSIMQSLTGAGHALVELELSKNPVGAGGSSFIASYFSQPACVQALQFIYLSGCKLDVGKCIRALQTGEAFRTLRELDVSENAISKQAATTLSTFLDKCETLVLLDVSRTGLDAQGIEVIGAALCGNISLSSLSLGITGNDLSKASSQVSFLIENASNIAALYASDCKFPKDGMTLIFEGLALNRSLRVLDLSRNLSAGNNDKARSKIFVAMGKCANAVKAHPTLEYLAIAGDGEKRVIGREIDPVFDALRSPECKVHEIDVSNNKCGDTSILTLIEAIKENKNLKSIRWDGNSTGVSTWSAFLAALKETQNTSLVVCPAPRIDVDRLASSTKDKILFRATVKKTIDEIRDIIKNNARAADPPYESPKTRTLGQRTELARKYTVTELKAPPSTKKNLARAKSEGLISGAPSADRKHANNFEDGPDSIEGDNPSDESSTSESTVPARKPRSAVNSILMIDKMSAPPPLALPGMASVSTAPPLSFYGSQPGVEHMPQAPNPPQSDQAQDDYDDWEEDAPVLPAYASSVPVDHRASFNSGIDPNQEFDDSKYEDEHWDAAGDGWENEENEHWDAADDGWENDEEDAGAPPPPPPPPF